VNKTVLFSENIKPSEYRIIIYLNIDEKPFLGKSFDEKLLFTARQSLCKWLKNVQHSRGRMMPKTHVGDH
jgi:hypothetical protein